MFALFRRSKSVQKRAAFGRGPSVCRLSCEALEDRTVLAGLEVLSPGNLLATLTTGGAPAWSGTQSATAPPLAGLPGPASIHLNRSDFYNPSLDFGIASAQAWSDYGWSNTPLLLGVSHFAMPGRAAESNRMQFVTAWTGTTQGGDRSSSYWDARVTPGPLDSPDGYYRVTIDWNTLSDVVSGSVVSQSRLSFGYDGSTTRLLDGPLSANRSNGAQSFVVRANDVFRLSSYLETTALSTNVYFINAINFSVFLARTSPPVPPPPPPVVTPDIAVQSAQLQSATSVQFTYQTTGNPGPFQVGLYRSTDTNFDSSDLPYQISGLRTITPANFPGIATETLTVSPNEAIWKDSARPYILVVADPGGVITESDDFNNGASFTPPSYCSPGDVFSNVLLPETFVPIPLIKTTPIALRFAPLGLNFTTHHASAPGALCSAVSNEGALSMYVTDTQSGSEFLLGYSTGQGTLTVFGGADPYVRWNTSNFQYSPPSPLPALPWLYNTGPLQMEVRLSQLALSLADPFEQVVRVAEQYFHQTLSQQLPGLSDLFDLLLVIEDPGATCLLVTDPNGRQIGQLADGTTVSEIPFSVYVSASPMVLVFDPRPGVYETQVRGLASGTYSLAVGTVVGLSEPRGVQSFSGILGVGQTTVYVTQLDFGSSTVTTALDPDRTLAFLAPYIAHLLDTQGISNHGIANALDQKLKHARQRLAEGDTSGARSGLTAFLNQVEAQRGKHITHEAADSLANLVRLVLQALPPDDLP